MEAAVADGAQGKVFRIVNPAKPVTGRAYLGYSFATNKGPIGRVRGGYGPARHFRMTERVGWADREGG